jgi:multiple sugar transport system ATP-binding protein
VALIEIEGVTKRFGRVVAVEQLSLRVEPGDFLTLLGPSGCGKTTVLRMIAGLEVPDEGEIRIKGEKVFSSGEGIFIPPGKRGVGLVFQSYALWPHMSLFANVAFGLQVQGLDREHLQERVATILEYMHLRGMEKRFPQEMSGGEQQRVALARMLVTRPSIFLMDEPLSNLDAKLRMEMRAEIKRIHREAGATTVYVTHDQTEALTMSTRVAVMDRGILQQVDTPGRIYRSPANLFVADFVGSPTINFVPGKIIREEREVFFEGEAWRLSTPSMEDFIGKEVVAAIRPEDLRISKKREQEDLPARVYSVLPAGPEVIIRVKIGNLALDVREMGEVPFEVEEPVYLRVSADSILFYDQEKGNLLVPTL